MKKLILFFIVANCLLIGCEKEIDPVSTVETVPEPMILNGPPFVHVPVGGPYVEQGATFSGTLINPTESELDINSPGLYEIKYITVDSRGFKSEASRGVLVLNYTPPPTLDSNFNIEGDYLRELTGIVAHVYRMANGLYISSSIGGVTPIPAYFVTPDTLSMDIPSQITYGHLTLEGNSEKLTTNPPPITYEYRIAAAGFGTGIRIFVKQ